MAKKTTKKKQTKKPPKQTAQRAKKTASKPQKATPRNATKPSKKQTKKPPKQTASKKAKKPKAQPKKAAPRNAAKPQKKRKKGFVEKLFYRLKYAGKNRKKKQKAKVKKKQEYQDLKIKVEHKKRSRNVALDIPNGRTLQTRDEYFERSKDYRKAGYENRGLYRGAVVVDSNREGELALIILTKSERGEEVEGRPKSKFRPFVETKDDNGNPIRFGEKFKENPSRNDLSPAAVAKIKKLTFRYAGNAAENRKKVREIKKRK